MAADDRHGITGKIFVLERAAPGEEPDAALFFEKIRKKHFLRFLLKNAF